MVNIIKFTASGRRGNSCVHSSAAAQQFQWAFSLTFVAFDILIIRLLLLPRSSISAHFIGTPILARLFKKSLFESLSSCQTFFCPPLDIQKPFACKIRALNLLRLYRNILPPTWPNNFQLKSFTLNHMTRQRGNISISLHPLLRANHNSPLSSSRWIHVHMFCSTWQEWADCERWRLWFPFCF